MRLDINTIIPIIASILYGVILLVVISSKPRTQLRQAFAFYLLVMFVWSISAFIVLMSFAATLPWFRLMASSGIAMAISIFHFVETLFSRRLRWSSLVYWYGITRWNSSKPNGKERSLAYSILFYISHCISINNGR